MPEGFENLSPVPFTLNCFMPVGEMRSLCFLATMLACCHAFLAMMESHPPYPSVSHLSS